MRRLVPPVVARRIRKALKPTRSAKRPVLSVIVPVYNVESYLEACLDSLLNQTLKNLEIIVIDDGSTDGCPEIIAAYAARDKRIRALHQENAGQGPARNFGVEHARGKFLTFMDADDMIPADAYQYMVKSLERSGSDFSVGAAKRVKNGQLSSPVWNGPVHDRDRIGITIDDWPSALLDVIACNRMFRRDFWLSKVGGFRGGVVYEDHVPMVVAYVRSTSFDLLARTTYHWRIREDMTSTGQQKHVLSNLADRVEVKREAWEILEKEASAKVQAAWIGRVLDTDFPPYIEHAVLADDEYRSMLQGAFAKYRTMANTEAMSHVRLLQKIRGFLVGSGAWDQLEPIQRHLREGGSPPPTEIHDGRIFATPALSDVVTTGLPASVREMGETETVMRSCLRHARWLEGGRLELTGWAYVKNIDLIQTPQQIEAWLQEVGTDNRVELEVERLALPDATRWSGQRHANVDNSGFRVVIDTTQLVGDVFEGRNWQLRVKVLVSGVVREGSVRHTVVGSSASMANLQSQVVGSGGLFAVPRIDVAAGFLVTIRPSVVAATDLNFVADQGRLSGRVVSHDPDLFHPVSIRVIERATKTTAETSLDHESGDSYGFSLELPVEDIPAAAEFDVRVYSAQGTSRLLEWPAAHSELRIPAQGNRSGFLLRSPHGYVRVMPNRADLVAEAIEIQGSEIRVTITGASADRTFEQIRLANPKTELPFLGIETAEDKLVWRFGLTFSEFGLPARPLPTGGYWVEFTDEHGEIQQLGTTPDLRQSLPVEESSAAHLVRLTSTGLNQLRIHLNPPLADDERGNWAHARLIEWYQQLPATPELAALFQCYRGETATDSQLALHQRLHETRPEVALYWGVADHSTYLPDGAIPLLIGSRSYYEKLASVTYLCNNIDFDTFFRKRDYQRYLQTFHGYPFKSMGKTFWEGKGLPADRIAYECERRGRDWDSILVPADFCVEMYRQEYDYSGDVLVSGYPRSDVLVSPKVSEIRERVRRNLGIRPDQTVVLYAPTYRDSLTTKTFAAKRFDELDLDQLTAAVGEDHVILLRGHNNNQREQDRVRGQAQIIDVTDYPEINDLTIAADAALLDYSSLRFDWAITGKPVLFFVPDLEDYFALRPPLFDYAKTVPGPLLRTTDEVIDSIRRLPEVAAEYEADLARFNAEYNQLHDGSATDRVLNAFFTQ